MTIFLKADILHHATKGKVDRVAEALTAEYPALSLAVVRNASGDTVEGVALMWSDGVAEAQEITRYSVKNVPSVGDLAFACEDAGLDPEAVEIADAISGSVVPQVYRKMYKDNSTTGRSCGDWLAEWFAQQTIGASGVTDIKATWSIFVVNGLDMSAKWAQPSETPGWNGRFRMNGRQVLEKQVAWNGFVLGNDGVKHDVPAEDLQILKRKHAKWLDKKAKRENAMEVVGNSAAGK